MFIVVFSKKTLDNFYLLFRKQTQRNRRFEYIFLFYLLFFFLKIFYLHSNQYYLLGSINYFLCRKNDRKHILDIGENYTGRCLLLYQTNKLLSEANIRYIKSLRSIQYNKNMSSCLKIYTSP